MYWKMCIGYEQTLYIFYNGLGHPRILVSVGGGGGQGELEPIPLGYGTMIVAFISPSILKRVGQMILKFLPRLMYPSPLHTERPGEIHPSFLRQDRK